MKDMAFDVSWIYTLHLCFSIARIQVLPDAPVWPPRDVVGKLGLDFLGLRKHEVDRFLMCDVVV